MCAVKGIVMNASVLLAVNDDENGIPSLAPAADYLLRKLRYSNIYIGISYGPDLSAPKVRLLQENARLYSYNCFVFRPSAIDNFVSAVSLEWGDNIGSYMHVISSYKDEEISQLISSGWLITVLRSPGKASAVEYNPGTDENPSKIFINKLEELPLTICHLNKKAMGKEVETVGYLMKPSREEDFAKRGAFPLNPTPNGLIFVALNYELPISWQLQQLDGVLHKATDDIITVEMSSSSDFENKVTYTEGMQELQRCIGCHPECRVIDPFSNIYPVLDRLKIQQILGGLENLNSKSCSKIRGPHFLKVVDFREPKLEKKLADAKLSLPNIVKPQVACGVSDAHSMAIVFKADSYKDLNIPLPAIVQEYVDHSSTMFKFYVVGKKIFFAIKKSTPNADTLIKLAKEKELKPLLFDSLKSLPVDKDNQQQSQNKDNKQIDHELVTDAANWLRRVLDLTIFGFDVVIQESTGDHVIVDVNYLPSFKEVPDEVAIPTFWEAIKEKLTGKQSVEAAMLL
ncbi:Inositol 1,3,4-trisphosphate 5/6-kinase 4 [Capsicum annuum]|uniref:inositol-1,3,4-trisphosphate 5/6-kinase n=2 Tax=Capsicum annuum TaxID=4072 RepID=A0A1U8EU66_CAPAN|nr:inositol 1,3,4-trisphosphate 5/6-kinase 4 isoform X1 [Capsicum annuum]KAF3645628.1 Inositol 1,3,4-trisphosphate 5/6-kinase 4 [Capsicum annuum]PHT95566.1 Inositol 1,3,4-trisphosphate 5/6-kinase 4 [Capsicum annuum]